MRLLAPLLLASVALGLQERSPSNSSSCSEISDALEKAAQNDNLPLTVPGEKAYDCLTSMPFHAERAADFLKELRKYIEFHSTLEALNDPPETYQSTSTDILGGLDEIENREYSNQYEFDRDITVLLNSANDGHLVAQLCSLQLFQFGLEPPGLVSVSKDGLTKPELYLYGDAALVKNGNEKVSPVSRINGQSAGKYLGGIAKEARYQDPDARWNGVFSSKAVAASGNVQGASGAFVNYNSIWPGVNSTMIEFRNGSSKNMPTVAKVAVTSLNSTGEALFKTHCMPQPKQGDSEEGSQERPITPPYESGPLGYPETVIRDPYNQMNGFDIDDETVAMLIPSFEDAQGMPSNQSSVFADTATKIVDRALKTRRSKIVIDVSANGGGNIVRAFDLFKLFFPTKFPYSATRFRRSDATESMAMVAQHLNVTEAQQIPLAFQSQVTPDQKNDFESVDKFLGDEQELGVNVSSLFANFNYTAQSDETTPIRGYGDNVGELNRSRPFRPEDILIVGDGMCSSTCTTFVNLMTNVGGVRTVTFGGRPREEPMQIMGGVRGAQSLAFSFIDTLTQTATQLLEATKGHGGYTLLPKDDLERANRSMPIPLDKFPLQLPGGSVNFRNAYQEGQSDLPLQFEYQASDCRLFYKFENVEKPGTTWKAAMHAVWGNGQCVKGSTGGRGSPEDGESSGQAGQRGDGANGGNGAGSVRMGGSLMALVASLCASALV